MLREQDVARVPPQSALTVLNIYVLGLFSSGTEGFIKTISQHVQLRGTAPGEWLHGWLPIDEQHAVHFRKPPTPRRYDFLWMRDLMSNTRNADGFIILMDSTRPKFFGEFLSILYLTHGYHPGVPIVVGANMQDKRNAWSAHDIQLGLSISPDIPVLPCVASHRESVKNVLLWLLYRIYGIEQPQ